jgi:20S proteasome alpha/beta subunit
MTTIAFKEGALAADTMSVTAGLQGTHKKIHDLGSFWLGGSGDVYQIRKVVSWVQSMQPGYFSDMESTAPHRWETWAFYDAQRCDPGALLVCKETRKCWRLDGDYWEQLDRPFYAIGSGRDFAMGAMQAGASAERAIEVACELDAYSSKPVEVVS